VRRQLIHMSGAITPFYLHFLYQRFSSWAAPEALVAVMLAIGYCISHLYRRGVRLPIFATLVDIAEREEDRQKAPGRGTFRFFMGVLATMLIFGSLLDAPFFVVGSAILVLALGDSMSTLAGKKLGRRRLPYNPRKSIEGSALGTLYAFLGVLAYLTLYHGLGVQEAALLAAAAAVAGMLAESLPLSVDDNFVIPLVSSAAVYLLVA